MLSFFLTLLFSSVSAVENGVYVGRRIPAWLSLKLENGQMNLHMTLALVTVIKFENVPFTTSRINEEVENELNLHLDSLYLTEALIGTNRLILGVSSTIEASGVTATYYKNGPDGTYEQPAVVVTVRDITDRKILKIVAEFYP
jgi:hypothetical protein